MKTHFMFNSFFSKKLHRLWDNAENYGGEWGATNYVTIWCIRVACWISKTTCTYANAHAHAPEYPNARTHRPICNTYCFSTATMIRERTWILCYTYIVCLVYSKINLRILDTCILHICPHHSTVLSLTCVVLCCFFMYVYFKVAIKEVRHEKINKKDNYSILSYECVRIISLTYTKNWDCTEKKSTNFKMLSEYKKMLLLERKYM